MEDGTTKAGVSISLLTPEQKEALAELNEKVSSTGMTYREASDKIKEIAKKYYSDEYMTSGKMNSSYFIGLVVKKWDPSKLPEPAKTEYREAVAARDEIENNNSALVKKAGINHGFRIY